MQNNGLNEKQGTSRPATREEVLAIAYRNGWEIKYQGEILNPNREKRETSPGSSQETKPGSSSQTALET